MTLLHDIAGRAPSRYDPNIAYLLSIISTWCYGEADLLKKVLARESMAGRAPKVRPYTVRNPALPVDANAFLITFDEGPHVLSFRGTEPTHLIDVLTDALVERHVWDADKKEWVHRGFFLSMDVLWPDLVHDLSDLKGDVYFTGHSLGGAIAVLAARRFLDEKLKGPVLRGVYTFGQPMVGNETFAERSWDMNLHRHVYERDVVAYLPPLNVGAGDYVHFGDQYASVKQRDEKTWRQVEDGYAKPSSCHLAEILPAFLTPIMARLNVTSVPLLAANFGLRALGITLFSLSTPEDLLGLPKLVAGRALSFEDHIPTHYVDVSRASRSEDAHSESASKRGG